jgi:hypothetical protein
MNGCHQLCIAGKSLPGGCVIGLQQVPNRDLLRLESDALLLGQVVLHVTPAPLKGVPLGPVGREPYGLHMCRPSKPLGHMGSTVISA